MFQSRNHKRKRIAFFIPSLKAGGVEKVLLNYANALVGDYDISIIVVNDTGVFRGNVSHQIVILNCNKKRIRQSIMAVVFFVLRYRFDYIVTGTIETNLISKIATIFSCTKTVASIHSYQTGGFLFKRVFIPWVLNGAHRVFSVSKGLRDRFSKLGVRRDKIQIIYNPVECEKIMSLSLDSVADLPKKYLVFVGRLTYVKNISLLLDAFKIFVQKHDDFSMVVVGDGSLRKSLFAYSIKKGLAKKVIWVGEKTNPYPYIKNAQALVLSSRSEGFPLVVLESLCLGVNVVTTPTSGPCEILDDEEYGFVSLKNNDAEALAESIRMAVEHPKNSELLKSHAEKFDINRVLPKFKSLFS